MAEASLIFRGTENLSETIRVMRNAVTPFRADVAALQQELDTLGAKRVELKLDLEKARRELKEAKKAFEELDDATADDTQWREAQEKYDSIAEKLRLVGKQANATEKDLLDATDAISRADNRAAKSNSGGSEGVLSTLGKAGLLNMVGGSLSGLGTALVSSALGGEGGTMFSSTLSGVVSGAAMGSLAGPIGTAIGAAVGGISGLISGGTQIFQQRDEAFKSYVQDQYNSVTQAHEENLTSGSTLAAQRELDQIAFSKLLGGDTKAANYLSGVRDMANRTPFLYSDLTAMSKSLAPAFGKDPDRMLGLLSSIGDAGAALGMGTSDMQMVGTAISRLESTGKTTLEYLNILQERGIDAYGFLAEGLGKSKGEMLEMVSKGLIPGADAAKMIQEGMEGAYKGAMELQSLTFSGLSSTVAGLQQEIQAAEGEAYNKARASTLQTQIDAMSGESGAAMTEAAAAMGAWQAELDNLKDQAILARVEGLLAGEGEEGQAYLKAKAEGNAAEMGRLVMLAQVQGMNDFNSSPEARQAMDANIALVEAIRQDPNTVAAYRTAGYDLGQEMTKGLADALISQTTVAGGEAGSGTGLTPGYTRAEYVRYMQGRHAAGLERVPYDGYAAILHEGERVLTAAEARAADRSGGDVSVLVSGNNFTVRSDSDISAIAQALADEIAKKRMGGRY